MAYLNIQSVSKHFGETEVIPPLDLAIEEGSFAVLVGPSGCGKSTLLRMIAGLEEPDEGAIELAGRDITLEEPSDREIAMVFQSYALYPHMTVEQNIEFGMKLARVPRSERVEKIRYAAEVLQLAELLDRKPAALSGGQRQRVAIGRAIVRNPKVFLFDEPLSNLDAALRAQMRVELAELHRRLGTTMVYVTHDQVEAMTLADTIVVMNSGRIEQTGSPLELYERPATRFVAEFIGAPRMNMIGGSFARLHGAHTIGLRPEHIAIAPKATDKTLAARIRLVERLGNETVLYCSAHAIGELAVRLPGNPALAPENEIFLLPSLEAAHRFDANGARLV